jgi:lipopolysaccharide biosynthesis glycosyltransferase
VKIIFTICSNNYLGQALALWESIQHTNADWNFVIGLVDKPIEAEVHNARILPVDKIEPDVLSLAEKFNIIELNTAVKPRFFEYFLVEEKAEKVVYLDPDIYVYHSFDYLEQQLEKHNFILTPHILSPLPIDAHKPEERLFLNYGLYNLGFLAVQNSNETLRLVRWWKQRTYNFGYDKTADGLFTDQLWLNFAPILFDGGSMLKDPGYNMGPWNIHERYLSIAGDSIRVNQEHRLVFYHFSGYTPGVRRFHWDYDRFSWSDRDDLQQLYIQYEETLGRYGFESFKLLTCWYVNYRKQHQEALKLLQIETERREMLTQPTSRKIMKALKSRVPKNIRQAVHAFRQSKPLNE